GMALARQIAHATYRTAGELNTRFGHDPQGGENPLAGGRYAVESYLDYHGKKLTQRFDPGSYRTLTRAMITHDIGRGRGGTRRVAGSISALTLVIGVDSDRLFPVSECAELARQIPGAQYQQVTSSSGHDGFLVETRQVEKILADFVAGL
ncbi:MAG: alpha/beta fold hydrolase, partial [Varibaculum cambriense]|nr:alpha/beta fold hydrolase [Varibaculum cambriense]